MRMSGSDTTEETNRPQKKVMARRKISKQKWAVTEAHDWNTTKLMWNTLATYQLGYTLLVAGKQYPCNHQDGVCRLLRWILKRMWLKSLHLAYLHGLSSFTISKAFYGKPRPRPTLQRLAELRCQSRSQNIVECCQNQWLTYGCGSPGQDCFVTQTRQKLARAFQISAWWFWFLPVNVGLKGQG